MIQEDYTADSEESPDCQEYGNTKQMMHSPLYEESKFVGIANRIQKKIGSLFGRKKDKKKKWL